MIDLIKEALEKATPGKWYSDGVATTWYGERVGYWVTGENFIDRPDGGIYGGITCSRNNDAHLIANTPTYLTYLLSTLEEAQKEIERLNTLYNTCVDDRVSMRLEYHVAHSENKTMREALEWYASGLTYEIEHQSQHGYNLVDRDGGEKARFVLSTLSTKEDTTCTK